MPVVPANKIVVEGNFQQRAEHIEKRNQLQHDGEREQTLKGFLDAGSCQRKVQHHQDERNNGVHDQRGVGRGILRMHLAEPRGQIGIQSSHERDARGAAEPGGADAGDGKTEQATRTAQ